MPRANVPEAGVTDRGADPGGDLPHILAVVADGGLVLTEIDTRTMRSKRYENLFVIGDLLHIARPSGGYSLQLCWTSGYIGGSHA